MKKPTIAPLYLRNFLDNPPGRVLIPKIYNGPKGCSVKKEHGTLNASHQPLRDNELHVYIRKRGRENKNCCFQEYILDANKTPKTFYAFETGPKNRSHYAMRDTSKGLISLCVKRVSWRIFVVGVSHRDH